MRTTSAHSPPARSRRGRYAPRLGATLADLVVAMALMALAAVAAVPPARHALDALAARAAANALVAGVLRARTTAVGAGGAALVVAVESARFWVEDAAGRRVGDVVDLTAEYGVRLSISGGAGRVRIGFSSLGIGGFASGTFRVFRGSALRRVTISSYGRARVW